VNNVPAPCTHRNKCAKQLTKLVGENPTFTKVAKKAGVNSNVIAEGLEAKSSLVSSNRFRA